MKRNYSIIVAILLMVLIHPVHSQSDRTDLPYSFSYDLQSTFIKNVPVEKMPYVDVEALKAEDLILDNHKDIPWRFGQNIDVNLGRETHGVEETLKDGSKLWRLSISSPGALSINLLFNEFILPSGAKLFIYNQDRSEIHGPFNDYNNQEDLLFATTLIRGDLITIEYFEPANVAFEGVLRLARVTHGYRGPEEFIKGFGNSGSCNVNVSCPEAAPMEDQIRSVCMLVTGSSGFCTGALINNTSSDGKPYVLSADHCYTNPGSVVFWFNWQSPTCANPPSSPPYDYVSGASNKARYSNSDMWLMEINQPVPSNFNVYYAGWNKTNDNNISGKIWGIHHPSGDIKKISWSDMGVSTTTYLQNTVPGNGTHWRITQWSDGTTTEGGSSGSPLFDTQGRIIGQLHGGYASCTSLTSDWYGKLGVSWTGGGTSASRLSDWLDPLNTGAETLEGYDPNGPTVDLDVQMLMISAPKTSYCSVETIIPEVSIKNRGNLNLTSATVSYQLNGGAPVTVQWTGNLLRGETSIVTFPQITLTPGNGQTFVASVSNPNNSLDELPANNELSITFDVFEDFIAPIFENFDGPIFPPPCWTQEFESGSVSWTLSNGGHSGNPSSAYSGTGNALFYMNSYAGNTTKLITPPLKIEALTGAVLKFRHAQFPWSGDQDELRVFYKTSDTTSWILLETYTAAVNSWTERVIPLPDASQTYYIAFEGKAKYGYGVCIDDVEITGDNVGRENLPLQNIKVFPNPSEGKFTLMIPGEHHIQEKIQVTDVNGRVVYRFEQNNQSSEIIMDLSHLEAGVYIVHYESGQIIASKKLIIY